MNNSENTTFGPINADPHELAKFWELAHRWWDANSEFMSLHSINPLRLDYIDRAVGLAGKKVLDIGCGGGILTEGMAARGAEVTGIDLSEKPLGVARLHLLESGLKVEYREISVEALAQERPGAFDIVTCMELLEHVPDPASTVRACATLVKPGGTAFFATLNRSPKAYLFAVIGAEYVLNLLPRRIHEYARFLRPAELSRLCRDAGLYLEDITGISYNPFSKNYSLVRDASVNYLMRTVRT